MCQGGINTPALIDSVIMFTFESALVSFNYLSGDRPMADSQASTAATFKDLHSAPFIYFDLAPTLESWLAQ